MALPAEFQLIGRYFAPLAGEGSLDLTDDAAVITPPAGRQLVLAADAMVAGVHFLPDDPPETIGRKLLRVNLSDLAAMGATPLAYLMTTALPKDLPPDWLERFCRGLAEDQQTYGLHVLGGDTVSIPGPISLSLTILGHVAPGAALRRNGARPGDDVWVSGTIGDGFLGLAVLQDRLPADDFLVGRYRLPRPRVALGQALVGLAQAAMDVSDGLVQDLGHLCRAGGCAAIIEAALVPISPTAPRERIAELITGGDDYELLFAASPGHAAAILAAAETTGIPVTRIGQFRAGAPDVTVLAADGQPLPIPRTGWSHF